LLVRTVTPTTVKLSWSSILGAAEAEGAAGAACAGAVGGAVAGAVWASPIAARASMKGKAILPVAEDIVVESMADAVYAGGRLRVQDF